MGQGFDARVSPPKSNSRVSKKIKAALSPAQVTRPATSHTQRKAHRSLPRSPCTAGDAVNRMYNKRPSTASPWQHNITMGTPKSVDRMWDSLLKFNTGSGSEAPESNACVEALTAQLAEDLEEAACLPQGPCPERTRIHGVVFEQLVEQLGPFKDMMARVRLEYDTAIRHYEREVACTPRLKCLLGTRTAQHDREVAETTRRHGPEVAALKAKLQKQVHQALQIEDRIGEAEDLLRRKKAEAVALQEQIEPFQANKSQLEAWEERYMKEVKEKKSRAKEDESTISAIEKQIHATRDAIKMSLAEKELLCQRVRKRELVRESEVNEAQEIVEALRQKQVELKDEHGILGVVLPAAHARYDELVRRKAYLKTSSEMTPRPNWTEIGDKLGVSLHNSSDANMKTLLEHYHRQKERVGDFEVLAKGAQGESVNVFQPVGLGRDIPLLVRHNLEVKRHGFRKHEVVQLIRTIWASKHRVDRKRKDPMSLSQYLRLFVKQKRPASTVDVMELTYNFLDGLYQYRSSDSEIELFVLVLTGEIGEEVHRHMQAEIEKLEVLVNKVDHKNTGQIPQTRLLECLRSVFPAFSDSEFRMLRSALEATFRSDIADHTLLFIDSEDGTTDVFLSTLRELQFQSHQRGIQALHYHLLQLQQLEGNVATIADIVSAYRKADPNIPEQEAQNHVTRLLEAPKGVLNLSVHLDKFIEVLLCSWLPRFSPLSNNFLRMSMSLSSPNLSTSPRASNMDLFVSEFRAEGPRRYRTL